MVEQGVKGKNGVILDGGKTQQLAAGRPFALAKNSYEATMRLCSAIHARDMGKIKELIPHAMLNTCDSNGKTPLMYAVAKCEKQVVLQLIEAGANINYQEKTFGSNALMCAAHMGNIEMYDFLLMHGANPDLKNNRSRTAEDIRKGGMYNDTPFGNELCECVANGF